MTPQSDVKNPRYCYSGIRLSMLLLLLMACRVLAADSEWTDPGLPSSCGDPDAVFLHQGPETAAPDLEDIELGGRFRILLHQNHGVCSISLAERKLIEQFAREKGYTPSWVYVEEEWQLLPSLLTGKGDMVAAKGESLAAGMKGQVEFTLPWAISHQQVVMRTDTGKISSLEDLALRQVALKRSSPAWTLLEEAASLHPSIDLVEIPSSLNNEMVLQRVASGQYDVTIMNSIFLESYLPKHPELSVALDLTEEKSMAWGVRANAGKLRTTLNQFLNRNHLTLGVGKVYLDDLPKIQQRHVLRVITLKNPSSYYLQDGKLYGFEYDLVKKFAKAHNLRVGVVLANSHREMQELLLQGRGDVIAASLPALQNRETAKIQYTKPYHYAAPVIVGRDADTRLLDSRDLEGRRVTLSADNPYRPYLETLRDRGINVEIETAEDGVNTETALFMVSMGMYDLTVVGSHQIKPEFARQSGLKAQFVLDEPQAHSWAVRAGDNRLLAALNAYLEREYRGEFYNIIYSKYFTDPIQPHGDSRLITRVDRISPFDELARTYAERYDFDWRLIVALMFQESHFNPHAASDAGAEGLMQLLPETAQKMGITNLNNPEKSIYAGVRYLGELRGRFENGLLLEDRTWFSLASYNAGYNRVKRARRIAEEMGLDKNRWFDNVEKAMLASSKRNTKDGEVVPLCRCGQTVAFVREIRTRYNNYVRLTESASVAASDRILDTDYILNLN